MIAYGLIGDEYAIATSSPEKQLFNNFNLRKHLCFNSGSEASHRKQFKGKM